MLLFFTLPLFYYLGVFLLNLKYNKSKSKHCCQFKNVIGKTCDPHYQFAALRAMKNNKKELFRFKG